MTHEDSRHFEEEVEGRDLEAMESWDDDLLDTVLLRSEPRSVGEIVKRVHKGRYKLDADFQRQYSWSTEKQTRLIESCLMRIPLAVFYVAEDSDGRIIVVDGAQRLTTFVRFLGDDFALSAAETSDPSSPVANKTFSQLAIHLQERIEDTQLTFYILDSKAPERARLGVLERVNSGAGFTRQQMRHCLHSGAATQWLRSAAAAPEFVAASGGSACSSNMLDREFINRFCAFYLLGYQAYSGDMDAYLAEALKKMNTMSPQLLANMYQAFTASMALNSKVFGSHAFRRGMMSEGENRALKPINIALFEALSSVTAKLGGESDSPATANLQSTVKALLCYEKFERAISVATNSQAAVSCRHTLLDLAVLSSTEDVRTIIYLDMAQDLSPDASVSEWRDDVIAACVEFNHLLEAGCDFIDVELKFANLMNSSPLSDISPQLFQNMRKHAEKLQKIVLP